MSLSGDEPPGEQVYVDADAQGARLDVLLAARFPEYSRTHLRRAIAAGAVTVDGKRAKPAYRVNTGQQVSVTLPETPREGPAPENIPLEILYEDAWLVAVNKPPGMVVHPSKGHWQGTLAGALAYQFARLSGVGGPSRPGIVHRLDRDTSGVILAARTDAAHLRLAAQFERRTVEKEYFAIVAGVPRLDRDWIEHPIGKHPYQREKMAVRHDHPTVREAKTFYEVVERFDRFAVLRVLPHSGRTHQIRVHLASIGCPVLCDRLYGGRDHVTRAEITAIGAGEHSEPGCLPGEATSNVVLSRQALHARRIQFAHPMTGESMDIDAPLPSDMLDVLDWLRSEPGKQV
jgi:23S rRNA pseudouridine1911/1915/1917 synthase